jgi:hypothetical protein
MCTAAALAAHPAAGKAVPLVLWTQAAALQSGSHSPAVPVQAAIRLLFQFRQPFACCSSSGSHSPAVPVQAAIRLLFQFRQPHLLRP